MTSFYVRIGGKMVGVQSASARRAVIVALESMTDKAFDALPKSEGNERVTISVVKQR